MTEPVAAPCQIARVRIADDVDSAGDQAQLVALPPSRRLRRWLLSRSLRAALLCYAVALPMAALLGKIIPRRRVASPKRIILTGKFYSENWVAAHIRPLAASTECERLWVVSTFPISPTPKVTTVYPPRWLCRLAGQTPARLVTFAWMTLRLRPEIVGGFHLLVNGLTACLLARLVGARSTYFCVGGPMEVLDGGIWAENKLFGRLEAPDPVIEQRLIRTVAAFDQVITMGEKAAAFFQRHGISTRFDVVSGAIDENHFRFSKSPRSIDLILVGRLAQIKRIDVFLHALRRVRDQRPQTSVVVVGDGELREDLEALSRRLGLERNVTFAGHQDDVAAWLNQARVFVLTSDSEGLALSLMEAMTCGLPVVVSDVGELGELVADGVNGYLVPRRSPDAFATRILDLLENESARLSFANAARRSAECYQSSSVTSRWNAILGGL